jgi:hypothetical protein
MISPVARVSLDSVVVRRPEPLTTPVDGELVILDLRRGHYLGIDPIGRRIWELLEQPRSVDALCAALEGQFEVSAETCRTDVLAFVAQLADAELVEIG